MLASHTLLLDYLGDNMSTQDLATLSGAFSTGSIPDGSDFQNLIDTLHDTINTILPDQFGKENQLLTTDGTNVSWSSLSQGPQGDTGPQGAQGLKGNAGLNLVPKGPWDQNVLYSLGDAVEYNGSSYESLEDNIGDEPGAILTSWRLFVAKGNTGDTGSQGVQGAQGHLGFQGEAGYQGPMGTQGFQGSQGFQGDTGADSTVVGPQGRQGTQGTQGTQGYQGEVGDTGNQGPMGYQGPKGYQGSDGILGSVGAQGPQGVTGSQGSTGANSTVQGPQGSQGQGFQVRKIYTTLVDLQADSNPFGIAPSEFALIESSDSDNNSLFLWDGTQYQFASKLADAIIVQGNQGSQGEMGFQGRQGVQGFQGNQGYQGLKGNTGDTGVQGAIGPQGFQGNQGRQGSQGFQGLPSTIQGPQGFQGDTGPQGSTGPQGLPSTIQGPQGYQGLLGPQGSPSTIQGPQGDTGHQGSQGTQGVQGTEGLRWKDAWNIDTAYSQCDVVFYSGSSWVAELNNIGSAPTDLNSNWAIVAEKGDGGVAYLDGGTIMGEDNGFIGSSIDDTQDNGSTVSTWSSSKIFQKTQSPKLFNYSEKVITLGNTGATCTLNASMANIFVATLSANCTATLSGAVTGQQFCIVLYLTNDATANRTIVFNNVKYEGGVQPIRTKTAGALDVWSFTTYNGGVTWIGCLNMRDVK